MATHRGSLTRRSLLLGAAGLALAGCVDTWAEEADSATPSRALSLATSQEETAELPEGIPDPFADYTRAEYTGPLAEDVPIHHDGVYRGVYLDISVPDFLAAGFAYGDAVRVAFSNGYVVPEVPFYSGNYCNPGDLLLMGTEDYPAVRLQVYYSDDLWDLASLTRNDTATITVAEAAKYLPALETFAMEYSNNRADYATDEAFANYRAMAGGRMREQWLFRGASPVCDYYNRAGYADALMAADGVRFDLDLSDSAEEVATFVADARPNTSPHFADLQDEGAVALLDLSINYLSEAFAATLASGLVAMSEHEGPYYIHCIEGKYRTGFVCLLLEALVGATYDELEADYMVTYDNYYGINPATMPDRYEVVARTNLTSMLRFLTNAATADEVPCGGYELYARAYLLNAGMTGEQVDALEAAISA